MHRPGRTTASPRRALGEAKRPGGGLALLAALLACFLPATAWATEPSIQELQQEIKQLNSDLNAVWIITAAAMVFLMQAG